MTRWLVGGNSLLRTVLWAAAVAVLLTSSVWAADLTAAEKQNLDGAKKYLAQLQTNLKLATDTAGPGEDTPPPNKAKLAGARLQTARQSAANVVARLDKLPADNADVKTVRADYDTAMKAVAALEDRLAGKNEKKPPAVDSKQPAPPAAPAPADAPAKAAAPAAPAGEQRLDYRGENALKIAQSNVDSVTASADALDKVVAQVNAAKDKSTIPPETLSKAAATIEAARRHVGFAEAQFKTLPADHSKVKAASDELRTGMARVDAADKVIGPLAKQSAKAGDPGTYPDLQADTQRLRDLSSQLAVGNLQANRTAVAELVGQSPAIKEEGDRISKKYASLLEQRGGDAAPNLRDNSKRLTYSVQQFEMAIAREKQMLPQQIDADLAQVNSLTETAVRESRPAYFAGGIADNLRFAEERLTLYAALDPEGAKASAAKIAQARESVKKQEGTLAGAIIAANELPADKYAGADKTDLARRATETIKAQNPKAEVLAVRFPVDKWDRETKWRYENRTWRLIDRSRLQAQVIVKRDASVAEIRPVNLWTDHANNNAISATPLFGDKEELSPGNLLPTAKIK
jgi:hypothetical protein